ERLYRHPTDIREADRFIKDMGRGLIALFLVCCALVALTLVNLTAARDADAAESARIEFEHTPSAAEWEAIKSQIRYWQQLADQEPAR
ncbi:hypothetical protein MRX96_051644, partial [Rhipicephalus microplus]